MSFPTSSQYQEYTVVEWVTFAMFCVVCVRYEMVRRGALASGARAGPVAMVVYSCTGRGKSIFGEEAVSGEAHIADEVSRQGSWGKQAASGHARMCATSLGSGG